MEITAALPVPIQMLRTSRSPIAKQNAPMQSARTVTSTRVVLVT
jgi:hypothetical protein